MQIRVGLLTPLFLILCGGHAAGVEDARPDSPGADEILERAFDNIYADDYVQTMVLSTRSRGGRVMTRTLQITRKQSETPGKALVRFLDPYEVRRTSILILENDRATDDLYVYLPAARMTRHLSSSQRADSFFGTDLSYEDVEPKHARDYDARIVGRDSRGETPCTLIEFEAKPHYESTYDQMVSCIEPNHGLIYWTDFHRNGSVVKRLEIDPANVRNIGGRHIPFTMLMKTPGRRTETEIRTETYDLKPAIPETLFTTWNLESGDAAKDLRRAGSSPEGLPAVSAEPPEEE